MISPEDIRRWWSIFHPNGELVEIRALSSGRKRKPRSGYFTSCEAAIKAMSMLDEEFSIYAPINLIEKGCSGREQFGKIIESDTTTSDGNIVGRCWLLIDLDPDRPSGTNATEEEKLAAKAMMVSIGKWMLSQGFSHPIVADSGNGYHLYYRISLANTTERTTLVKDVLHVLDMLFSNDKCKVDTSVFNAARIAKVIGTQSRKGSNQPDRPYRMSRFISKPEEDDDAAINNADLLLKIADMLPKVESPSRFNGYSSQSFDLDSFIDRHGIAVRYQQSFGGGTKYILEECPFDSNHKAPDAAIFKMNNGAIGFKCLHNSCSHYTWRDLRMHFEPEAYSERDRAEMRRRQDYYSREPKPAPVVIEEDDERGHKWLPMSEIQWTDQSQTVFIPTGFLKLDKKTGGLALGDVTVLTGLSGAGKSSLLDCILLNAVDRGYKAAIWSGELQPARFQSWIDQCAAGKGYVIQKKDYDNIWYCPREIASIINGWLSDKLWLYNNNYGSKFSQIFSDVKDCVRDKGTQLIVLDNLMSLSLDKWDGDKFEKQTEFIREVKDFAKASNIAVILVCHPRKEQMNGLLRMESISGTADLFNLSDNVLIAHRAGLDFTKRAKAFFSSQTLVDLDGYDEVVEVAKNRAFGVKDELIGLYFEKESRRFLNDRAEYTNYGWDENANSAMGSFNFNDADDLPY